MRTPIVELRRSPRPSLLGVKGPGAVAWLQGEGIDVPAATLAAARLADGTLVARLGASDVFLEAGADATTIFRLRNSLTSRPAGVFVVPHEEAVLVLRGAGALRVFAQTCALDMSKAPRLQVQFSRVAGASAMMLAEDAGAETVYRLWVDVSYSEYLEETLAGIVSELTAGALPGNQSRRVAAAAVR